MGADRVVRARPARGSVRERVRVPEARPLRRREAGLRARRVRQWRLSVEAAGIVFERRRVGPEEGAAQLRIEPLRPVDELREEARAARPPVETGEFRSPDLAELTALDPTIKLDIRYATTNNFLSAVFYPEARAFLQRPAAEALVRAHRKLRKQGYGLLVHDGYRPWT